MAAKKTEKKAELTEQQLKAIDLLATTGKQKQVIAQEVGVTPVTLSNWLANDDFKAKLNEAYTMVFNSLLGKSIQRLNKMIDSPNETVAYNAISLVIKSCGLFTQKKDINVNTDDAVKIEIDYGK